MADDEAENAFFQAQALNTDSQPPIEEQEGDNSDAESDDYDPSLALGDQYSASFSESKQPDAGLADPSPSDETDDSIPNPTVTSDADVAPDVNADASQTSDSPDLSQNPPPAQSSTPVPASAAEAQPKTRTIGGFEVDEDEDDEGDAEYEPPAVLGGEDVTAMPVTMSEDPSSGNAMQNTSPDVSSHQAEQGPASGPAANSSYSPVPVPNIDPSSVPGQSHWSAQELQSATMQNSTVPTSVPDSPASKGRLAHDRVGMLEDRIREDPRGDIPAWLELIAEHRGRSRLDSARETYERFLKLFPMAADQWVAYATMESELNEFFRLEQIFNRTLLTTPSVQLWSVYLDYIRRRNPLTSDEARKTISSAYDMAIQYVGMDKDSGNIWTDYIEFIRSGPGIVGGSGWQDQQKMDLLRKAYQRAIGVPTQAVNTLWKEYDQFEMNLNKLTGRKFLQEHSPSYMTARSSYTELQNITRDLIRTSLPPMPPVPGSEGDVEFATQVDIWKRWIAWEKEDPLVLKEDDPAAYKSRVVYFYKQALMALTFLPEMWFDAAEFCFLNDMEDAGTEFLKNGIDANPESCLLTFKRADRLEVTSDSEHDSAKRAAKVREPYDKLLNALYDLINKARDQETQDVSRIEAYYTPQNVEGQPQSEDEGDPEAKEREAAKTAQIDAVRKAHSVQINIISKTLSFAWISLMRSMRRIQGKGKPGEVAGSRQIFAEARRRGRITSDVYIASALMEYHCYKDPAATKIFERGAKLFPEDEHFALEYLKHLLDINDTINARAVFETTVRKLTSNPENVQKAKPIFSFLHEYESRYGDLTQVINLENRMRELYPADPTLDQFANRYSDSTFDPTSVRLILSPSQTRPKTTMPGISTETHGSPMARYMDTSLNSPKRSYPTDDYDEDSGRPRKFVRAESPMKSVQARRLDQPKRVQQLNGQSTSYRPQGSPAPLPREVVNLLSILPSAAAYNITRLSPEKTIDLLRHIDIPSDISQIQIPQAVHGSGGGQTPGMNPYSGYR
ncbi:RNA-processing protein, HAT helix [Penicillium griseofulvum]|uniref:mRNA 3'-end-processing protein RNA14 n=1 Tax=Penicillium patulum TaxID=5078 RepID=A0A135LIT2_PENPA|nr:RNA-processing protein, HAT helix [Penicillium griseofulvum]KXG48849.1 RNA-processing protein, HAT helix [Penicillium griseofulvum]